MGVRLGWLTYSALVVFIGTASSQEKDEVWELLYDGKVTIRLEKPRFTSGARPLAWTAEPAAKAKEAKAPKAAPAGPAYLEFREELSTQFKDGIVTFIPLASLARLEYDHDKKTVKAAIIVDAGKEIVLAGSTKFLGINKFNFEGTAKLVDATIPAGTLDVQDGILKTPVRGLRLHVDGKATAAPALDGLAATVVAQDKEKTEHKVVGLTAVYRVGAAQRLAPVLMFQKIGQVDVAKLTTLKQLPPAKKGLAAHDYEVVLSDGMKQTLTLLEKTTLDDNQPAQLVGLVGRVAVGYKLFPPHTIAEVRWTK